MKKITEIKTIIITIGITFTFLIFININFNYYQGKNYGILESNNRYKLRKAGYWEIGPIEIDDSDPSKNWAITAATYFWCNGSGTWEDPYLIENVSIDGLSSARCIHIRYSSVFFIIRNCIVYNSGSDYGSAGIKLYYTNNGILANNSCSNNNADGIRLENSQNITIINNTANNNEFSGLSLSNNSHDNFIINNTADQNRDDGLYIVYSSYSNISENRVFGNNKRGVNFFNSDFNNINNNLVKSNSYDGILLSDSESNNVSNNIILDNDRGLYLGSRSDYNNIIQNTIEKNVGGNGIGVSIHSDSYNNLIYLNEFYNNSLNANDDGVNNNWDNGSIGNYWDDYTGIDANGDGIGDTPYDVPPPGGSVDNYPIWEDGDELSPDIIINIPDMNDAFGINAPYFDITINDESPIDTTWYTIDGGTTNYTFIGLTGTINQTAWDNKETEIITLRFYANDSLGHIGFKDVLIWKDLLAPKITINSPTPNQLCGISAPTFNLQIIDPNLQEKKYSLNGRPNITFTTETQFSQTEWNQVGNGTVLIIFYAIDKVGNTNSSELIVRKDAYVPDIIIYSPLDNQKFGKTAPNYNISIIEEDLVSTWYTIEGIAGTFPFTGLTGSIDQDAWDDAPKGEITITFYAVDRAGNIGSESVVVIKSIPSEPAIPSYNLFLLLGILAVISILICKKVKKI